MYPATLSPTTNSPTTNSTSTMWQLLSNRALMYADGKPRPRCRGLLHFLATTFTLAYAAFILILRSSSSNTFDEKESTCSSPVTNMAPFLLCKSVTFGASAFFHLYPFQSVQGVTKALFLDLLCVPFSIIANGFLVLNLFNNENKWMLNGIGCLFLTNALCVRHQLPIFSKERHLGLQNYQGRTDTPRFIPLLLLTIITNLVLFAKTDMNKTCLMYLVSGILLNVAGGLVGEAVTKAHRESLFRPHVFWHVDDWWGLHEDMHLFMVLSDVCYLHIGL